MPQKFKKRDDINKTIISLKDLKYLVDNGAEFQIHYHDFVHGTDGDSEEDFRENSKGSIYFSGQNVTDRTRLTQIILNQERFRDYINLTLLPEKYGAIENDNHYQQAKERQAFYQDLVKALGTSGPNNFLRPLSKDNYSSFFNLVTTQELQNKFTAINIAKEIKAKSGSRNNKI